MPWPLTAALAKREVHPAWIFSTNTNSQVAFTTQKLANPVSDASGLGDSERSLPSLTCKNRFHIAG